MYCCTHLKPQVFEVGIVVVEIVDDVGADVLVADRDGQTPLDAATSEPLMRSEREITLNPKPKP